MAQVGSSTQQLHYYTVAVMVIAFFAILLYYPMKATLLEHNTVLLCILGAMFFSGIFTIAISNLAQDDTEHGKHNAQMPRRGSFLIFSFLIFSFNKILIFLIENILGIGVCISGISNIILKCLYIFSTSSYIDQLFFPTKLNLITLEDGYKMQIPLIIYQQQTHLVLLGLDQICSAFRNLFLFRTSDANNKCANTMSRIALVVMIVVEVTDLIFNCLRDTGKISLFSAAPMLSATRELNVTRCYPEAPVIGNSYYNYCDVHNFIAYISINVTSSALKVEQVNHTCTTNYQLFNVANPMQLVHGSSKLHACDHDIISNMPDFSGFWNGTVDMFSAYEPRVLDHFLFSLRLELMLNIQLVVLDTLLETARKTDLEYKNIEQHSGTARHTNQIHFAIVKFAIIGILVALIADFYAVADSQMELWKYTGTLQFIFVVYLPVLIGICLIYDYWRKPGVTLIIVMLKNPVHKTCSIIFACLLLCCKYNLFLLVILDRMDEWSRKPQENINLDTQYTTTTACALTRVIILVFYFKYVSVKCIYRLLTTDYHKQSHKMQIFTLMLTSDVDRKEREVKISRDADVNSNTLELILVGFMVCVVTYWDEH